jgi:hypothetical protein
VGIGGGGDVVGALAVAELARSLGVPARLGGVTWERRPIDPLPGPRTLSELSGHEPLNDVVALAGSDTSGPGGFLFAESRLAGVIGEQVALVDPTHGPDATGAGLADAAARLDCDRLWLIDVGGDALAAGNEPGLASPLCDALLVAAGPAAEAAGIKTTTAVVGIGCDGELTPAEAMARIGDCAAAGGLLGMTAIDERAATALEAAVASVPTEASAQALACARGERGVVAIRGGRRQVPRTALGGLVVHLDALIALEAGAPLARAVAGAGSLEEANERLHAAGVRSELDLERAPAVAP